ncbi:hypothetical protein Droror1_Dr00001316 [Drosera rotundifolia]
MLRGSGIPLMVLKYSPESCDVFIVSMHKVTKKLVMPIADGVTMSHHPANAMVENKQESLHASRFLGPKSRNIFRPSSSSETCRSSSAADSELSFQLASNNSSEISMDVLEIQVEELRIQLEGTRALYQRACKDLADAQHKNGTPPLSWFVRFKMAFEIATALAFLHSSKPETIIHHDLKPDNILLGKNYVSKISDMGLAKIIPETVPDAVTYVEEDSTLAGTFPYLDPEYLGTGTVRPKSDLYPFGVIVHRLLTGRSPNRLVHAMGTALETGSLVQLLDKSISDWPLHEAEELARVALPCCRLRCRDRPDLETEVPPVLKKLADFADGARAKRKIMQSAP